MFEFEDIVKDGQTSYVRLKTNDGRSLVTKVHEISEREYKLKPFPIINDGDNEIFEKHKWNVLRSKGQLEKYSQQAIIIYGKFKNGSYMAMRVKGSTIELGTTNSKTFLPSLEYSNFQLFTNFLVGCPPLFCENALIDALHYNRNGHYFIFHSGRWKIFLDTNLYEYFGKVYDALFWFSFGNSGRYCTIKVYH